MHISLTMAAPAPAATRLGRSCEPVALAHPGLSGIVPLADGHDAFAARALLADAADRTLDVRYYIWHNDMSGTLLFAALHRAADRGVRVRLLLDDNNTTGLDGVLAALDAHPNIAVRLFNPFKLRRWRLLGYLTDFARLNRRMHNKSFTADDQATIIGGRNVGDEYFDAGRAAAFVDLDVLAIGPVVHDVSRDFDRYWASASAIPADRVLSRATARSLADLAAAAARVEHDPAAVAYVEALARTPFVRDLLARRLPFEWAAAQMISDDPAKGLGGAPDAALLWPRLRDGLDASTGALKLVSPYFVPGRPGVEALAALAGKGVKIAVLTNSLEATDVAVVHSGYAKWRSSLLAAGIALFELKRAPRSSVRKGARRALLASGSSASSLHAKTFAVDRARVFIGSFNFDPRSARLNTEMGFLIDSPALADAIARQFADEIPARAYQVRVGRGGALQWIERLGTEEIVHEKEPGTSMGRRFVVSLLSVLPIEWLL
jgi:cardiolipin synthase C